MKPWRRIFTFITSLPNDLLLAWPAVLLVRLLWGENLHWEGEALVCNLKPKSWPARTWYAKWGGTTFGHGIFYRSAEALGGTPENYCRIQRHEHVHVEQCEAAMLAAFFVGLFVWLASSHWWAGLIVWATGYVMLNVGAWLTAWLRGENPYRGSTEEESAYAQN